MKSDICHQSVYELVHSEDRDELTQQLRWNSALDCMQQQQADLYSLEQMLNSRKFHIIIIIIISHSNIE